MEFKIGDWVIVKNTITQINYIEKVEGRGVAVIHYHTAIPNDTIKTIDEIQKWQPKEGEWCWYKHCLVKVLSIRGTSYQVSAPMFGEQWTGSIELEPFTNQLPTYIKDK